MKDSSKQRKKYLEAQIKTASKEQLLLMLYDGAIKNCNQAIVQFEDKNDELGANLIIKAQSIVAELISSLHFDKNQDVAKNLASLYGFVYIQLMEGSVNQDIEKLNNAIKILNDLRTTWVEAFQKVGLSAEGKQGTTNQVPEAEASPQSNKPPQGLSIQA